MTDAQTENNGKGLTAPYPAFQSLKTLIKPFKEHGAPNRIDRSMLTSFSGQVGSQVLTMLKFLDLTDEGGRPTAKLQGLVEAYDTDAWPDALAQVIRDAYAPLFKINLETASPKEFSDEFRSAYPAAEEVSRKSKTFFLNAAREAGIKISPYIMKNKKPRSAPTKKRTPKPKDDKARKGRASRMQAGDDDDDDDDDADDYRTSKKLPSETLLSLFESDMQQDEQTAIWTLIKYFKAKGQ